MGEQLPLCSSREVEAAIKRLGFSKDRSTAGSHQCYSRAIDGRTYTTVVRIGKKQLPRGTLRKILELGNIGMQEFVAALR